MNPLDKPITVRQLREAIVAGSSSTGYLSSHQVLNALPSEPEHTDVIRVKGSMSGTSVLVRVTNQPARRVRTGDLVTAKTNEMGLPRVTRVLDVDVAEPIGHYPLGRAVAISPEDAERLLEAFTF